jgi:hypothetical protein
MKGVSPVVNPRHGNWPEVNELRGAGLRGALFFFCVAMAHQGVHRIQRGEVAHHPPAARGRNLDP